PGHSRQNSQDVQNEDILMASAAQTPFGSSGALLEPTGTKHAVTRSDSGRAPNFLPPGTPL
ncbi:hypothetical protein DFQ26_003036, partial [Actinomortierella ambigua]